MNAACNQIWLNWGVFLLDGVPHLATKHPESVWPGRFELKREAGLEKGDSECGQTPGRGQDYGDQDVILPSR